MSEITALTQERTEVKPLFLTRDEVARMLRISVTEVDDLRRAGSLLAKKHGRKVLIPTSEVERYADSLPWDENFS